MSGDETVSEKRAAGDAELLAALRRRLYAEGVRSRVFQRVRLAIGTEEIPAQRRHHPAELIVYGHDGGVRARVTVRAKLWGTAFLVTPAGDAPGSQFPVSRISGVIRRLGLLAGDEPSPHLAGKSCRANGSW
ncbi:hypothetical protein Sme01_12490 [Sphaerisporangium melleum]|uniref:Uncharacterized protein n=1 Tax=Sphaerisporangium melleum TaxID=321316 RepID=A0A917RHQ1_9ACTN|nr:hypothetical protein [Sphaerisporangium melleum]GGL08895.1 hypothetical protein GCM10007964_58940 [Sphaerisporangium melleum]GII68773.1 hypothetical protein Sme01_12490 [Sphaerisporangium melleum]